MGWILPARQLMLQRNVAMRPYSGTLVKTKIAKFLNVSGNSLCGIE